MCLEVTEQSLDQHPSLATSHFLANYLTTHFYGELTADRHREIRALYMGSKVRRRRGCQESMIVQLPLQKLLFQASAFLDLCYTKS